MHIGSKELKLLGAGFLAAAIALTINEMQLAAGYALAGGILCLTISASRLQGVAQRVSIIGFTAVGAAAPLLFFTLQRGTPFLAATAAFCAGAIALLYTTRNVWKNIHEVGLLVWVQATVSALALACAVYLSYLAPFGEDFLVRRLLFTLAIVAAGLVLVLLNKHSYMRLSGLICLGFGVLKAGIYDVTHLHGLLRIAVFGGCGALLMIGATTMKEAKQ